MEQIKKTVILKGEAEGVFTMQRSAATRYALSWSARPLKGDIFVFDENGVYRLSASQGTLPIDISRVCAVAVGEDFAAKGQLKPFSWARARALLARERRRPEVVRPIMKDDANKPHDEPSEISREETQPKEISEKREEESAQRRDEIRVVREVTEGLSLELPEELAGDPEIAQMIEHIREKLAEREERKDTANERRRDESQKQQEEQPMPESPTICEDEEGAYSCPVGRYELEVSPFGAQFPRSRWFKHEYPSARGSWHYLTGELRDENARVYATAIALPGTAGVRPSGGGFTSFRRAGDGTGYWIKIIRA